MLEIMSGISRALHGHGYDLLVVHVDPGDTDWPRQYLDTGRVDGFILLSATCTPQHMTVLRELKAPLAIWGNSPERRRPASAPLPATASPAARPRRSISCSRAARRVAFIGGSATMGEVKDRYRGYEAALLEAGITLDPALVAYRTTRPASAASEMRRLLEDEPGIDAVFVNSDIMAIAAMDAIRETGRTVPDDVAVVGYDDISMAQHSNPPLTTIRQNGPLAGSFLADGLIQYLRTGVVSVVSIPADLVVRDSA